MNDTVDLERALAFVIQRIQLQAELSGKALTDEQDALLKNLPDIPVYPEETLSDSALSMLLPRELDYERLIGLARDARRHDVSFDSLYAPRWKWAVAVLKLRNHPMSWLLGWAKMQYERPWWDRPLLVVISLLLIICIVGVIAFATEQSRTWRFWLPTGAVCSGVFYVVYFVTWRLERWQIQQVIDRYRESAELRRS